MFRSVIAAAALIALPTVAFAGTCPTDSATLGKKLKKAVEDARALKVPSDNSLGAANIGFELDMWATVVGKDGAVCAIANSSGNATDGQWLGSRVISAQKAFTGNAFSLGNGFGPYPTTKAGFAISTANLYSATQPGGSLFGLQHSNPVWSAGAYGDKITSSGTFAGVNTGNYGSGTADPMINQVIGGVNVFGGGLGLYTGGQRVGGVGVSGDTSCMDHIVAWLLRSYLGLDSMKGVNGFAAFYATPKDSTHPDNIIFDISPNAQGGTGVSASGYGHPVCQGALKPYLTKEQADAMVRTLPDVK